ncbi:TPA: hypothetical protein DHT69_04160 [Candidatus Collierbacteria bacterium]|nr:hypothetical protein [Candidatus Collierbacteria bacterium]
MKVQFQEVAQKQLSKIPKTETKKIISKIEMLSRDNKSGKNLKGELKGFRSLRAWPYRIIYTIENNAIVIYSIAHRQSAYK